MAVPASEVEAALRRRRAYIVENLESLTLKSCRRQLEDDLSLERDALKDHKKLISKLIDQIMEESRATSPAGRKGSTLASQHKMEKKRVAEAAGQREKSKRSKQEAPAGGAGVKGKAPYSRRVEKLRSICKQATITIPPNIYMKNKTDDSLAEALEQLLDKHGLGAQAGPAETAKAKAKLQLQRELDGIDTSNILEGGRRKRQAAQLANYREAAGFSSSEEDSEPEGGGGSEEAEEAGSEPEASSDSAAVMDPERTSPGTDDVPSSDTQVDDGAGAQQESVPAVKATKLVDWSDDD